MSGDIRVVDPLGGDPRAGDRVEPVSGLVDRPVFQVGGYRLVVSRIETETAWHARDGATYGWVRAGSGRIGSGGDRWTDLETGDFLRIPGGTTHRFAAGDEPLETIAVVTSASPATTEARTPDDYDPGPYPGHDSGNDNEHDPKPSVVGPEDLQPTVESPDLVRETPFPDGKVLLMRVRAAGGAAAGWHHHGDNVYFGYTVDGPSETEYGPGGHQCARIEIGECFHVPPNLVHRDTNPTDTAHTGIIWLCGGEPWVVNVDGPR